MAALGVWAAMELWGDQEGKTAMLAEDPSLLMSRGDKAVAALAKTIGKMSRQAYVYSRQAVAGGFAVCR